MSSQIAQMRNVVSRGLRVAPRVTKRTMATGESSQCPRLLLSPFFRGTSMAATGAPSPSVGVRNEGGAASRTLEAPPPLLADEQGVASPTLLSLISFRSFLTRF